MAKRSIRQRTKRGLRRLGISFLAACLMPALAFSDERTCNEWQAVYAGLPDQDGGRVYAAFGAAEPTMPLPLTLTGIDRAGAVLWEFETIAWCFQGSGGCFMDLKMTDGTTVSGETDNPIRLVFAKSSPTEPSAVPDILVVAGLNAEFLDAQRGGGPMTLALSRRADYEEIVVPPEVFYFDRCTDG